MQLQIATWVSAMAGVTTLIALKSVIDSIVHQLGFRYFIYRGHFPGRLGEQNQIQMDTAPPAWHDYRQRRSTDADWDPLHLRALRAVTPILWRDVRSLHPDHFEKARELGLATGVTQPLHGPRGEWSSISFIKDRAGLRAERDILAVLPQCQLITSFAHDALAHIVTRQSDRSVVVRQQAPEFSLSDRENECLSLAALGKTIQQISGILPISQRTVAFHLANARRKLQVASLRHAVTKAASLGLIRAA